MRFLLSREDGDLIGTTEVGGQIALKVDVIKALIDSLPLPTGAATELTLLAIDNKLVPGNELGNVGDVDKDGHRANNLRNIFNFSGDGSIAKGVLPVGGCTTGRIRGRDEYVLFDGFDDQTGTVPAGVMIQIVPTGSWNGELLVQVSNDGLSWSYAKSVTADGTSIQTSIRSNGCHFANTAGSRYLRIFAASFDGDAVDALICASSSGAAVTYIGNAIDTELPTAQALSDSITNPVAPSVGSHMMAYNRVNSTWRRVTVDKVTSILPAISVEHHKIHSAVHFFVSIYDSDVRTAAPKYIRITTPNSTTWAHFKIRAKASGAGMWEFLENPVVSANGSTQTNRNNDRNSLTTSGVVVANNPTSGGDGTLLWTDLTAECGISEEEIILKGNEDYFFKFTPDADATKIAVFIEWYDHANIG